MDFVLDPPQGVGDIALGATRSEALQVLRRYGDAREFRRGGDDEPGWVVPDIEPVVFVYFDSQGLVDAVELGRPGDPAANQVTFRGVNLFVDTADSVISALEHSGLSFRIEEDGYAYTTEDLLLALWRDGSPVGSDGRPLYWKSVLVARPGYYP